MSEHVIAVVGCDATTRFRMELTEAELDLLKRLSTEVKHRGTGVACSPRFTIDDDVQVDLLMWDERIEE